MSAKKKTDWVQAGKIVADFVKLFTNIQTLFKSEGVGLEIIEWLLDEGKDFFESKLSEVIEQYRPRNLPQVNLPWPPVLKAEIDLDVLPSLPFTGATIEKHTGGGNGKVAIEKRADGLYVGGKKIILYRSNRQLGSKWIKGHELREELTGKPVLNATVLDFLFEHQEFIPDDWKGNAVFFWGTIYRSAGGGLCVRFLCWSVGGWDRDYDWLGDGWSSSSPAAVSAS